MTPVLVGASVIDIVAGSFETCARLAGGRLRCWGADGCGELGLGDASGRLFIVGHDETPADVGDVPVGASVAQVSVGDVAICARLGTLGRCWGAGSGYLGYGGSDNLGDDETVAAIPTLAITPKLVHIERGGEHTCVLLSDGRVKCWGRVVRGGLGYPGVAFANTRGQRRPDRTRWDHDATRNRL